MLCCRSYLRCYSISPPLPPKTTPSAFSRFIAVSRRVKFCLVIPLLRVRVLFVPLIDRQQSPTRIVFRNATRPTWGLPEAIIRPIKKICGGLFVHVALVFMRAVLHVSPGLVMRFVPSVCCFGVTVWTGPCCRSLRAGQCRPSRIIPNG